jgi:hypothetical protein
MTFSLALGRGQGGSNPGERHVKRADFDFARSALDSIPQGSLRGAAT